MRTLALALAALALALLVFVILAGRGSLGSLDEGEVTAKRRPYLSVERRGEAQSDAMRAVGAAPAHAGKQILFGDLHVHTTVSFDAFMMSLPVLQGEGAHPPADACDYARFCSALDFWSINDHAEGITPAAWRRSVDTIRQCNAVAVDPRNPDTVAFLGWEWTQVGGTPDTHWGHKNVILRDLGDDQIPPRPIGSAATANQIARATPSNIALGLNALLGGDQRYYSLATYLNDRASVPECDREAHTRDLPSDCMERAAAPGDLFRKLDEGDYTSIVIPHGTAWGMYTPPGSDWKKQLTLANHDPQRQTLMEVYSGHGNSEEYRDWRAVVFDDDGNARCPDAQHDYLPPCQRAAEIIETRCLEDGEPIPECAERAARTRQLAADALLQAHLTVPGYDAREWLDAGQCSDCFLPAYNHRPLGSAQYVMALSNFEEEGEDGRPLRFRFGLMASSDNHYARPGTGYKEFERIGSTESRDGLRDSPMSDIFRPPARRPDASPEAFDRENTELRGFQLFEMERQGSFFMTGGLVAAHATGRDRNSIWESFDRREVYGTSGPRILLWFDLLNAPNSKGGVVSMGGATAMREAPLFQVRAMGSFEQNPGCPDYSTESLHPTDLQHLCEGECYNPSDTRRAITRIEVVRVRPQSHPSEPISALIDDPWQSFDCPADGRGCAVTFGDPEHADAKRDALYYVRAIEAPALAINAGGVRCERDENGRCKEANLCGVEGVSDIGSDDPNCLAEHEPRAWSSPIFVDWPRG